MGGGWRDGGRDHIYIYIYYYIQLNSEPISPPLLGHLRSHRNLSPQCLEHSNATGFLRSPAPQICHQEDDVPHAWNDREPIHSLGKWSVDGECSRCFISSLFHCRVDVLVWVKSFKSLQIQLGTERKNNSRAGYSRTLFDLAMSVNRTCSSFGRGEGWQSPSFQCLTPKSLSQVWFCGFVWLFFKTKHLSLLYTRL